MNLIFPAFMVIALAAFPNYAQDSVSRTSQNETLPDVHVKLVLAESKTSYRIGEPIRLFLEFTADRAGYQAETIPDRQQPTYDKLIVSPDSGVFHWLEERMGQAFGRDYLSYSDLARNPIRVPLVLNDTLRLDQPGHYTVKVTTERVKVKAPERTDSANANRWVEMETNAVGFDVQPMSEADELKGVKRLSDLLDSSNANSSDGIAQELSFLTGDPSSKEKVKRLLNPSGNSNNYLGEIWQGLFIARNRPLVLQMLEAGLRDPKVPVTSSMVAAVLQLRFLLETSGLPKPLRRADSVLSPNEDPRLREMRESYLNELVAGLSKRTGANQTTTAMTILTLLPKDSPASEVTLREIRRVLVPQFADLHPFDQEAILQRYWEELRDPSLAPALKKMLAYQGIANKNIHDAALKRLIEISPEEARPFVIAEISNPRSLVEREILASIPDQSLPEVDEALLDQIRKLANSSDRSAFIYLDSKTSLLVRFATDSIYQDLMKVYRESGEHLSIESRAAVVAYFVSRNQADAIPLIEEALSKLSSQEASRFLTKFCALLYSGDVDSVLKKRLNSDDPEQASTAAYLIGKYGSADDQSVLEARLKRWTEEWNGRSLEADSNLQGTIERELVYALIHGKGWTLTPERIRQLQMSCLTKYCRQSNQVK